MYEAQSGSFTLVTVPGSVDTVVASTSVRRVYLAIWLVAGAPAVSPVKQTGTGQGALLATGIPFEVCYDDIGDLIYSEWHVWNGGANSSVVVIEGFRDG
jgi:hypothetical protein